MGGKKSHLRPKEVISHVFRCICGSEEIKEYVPGKMLCPHCRRFYIKEADSDAFALKGFLCENSGEGMSKLFELENGYACLEVQDKLIGAFSPDSKSVEKFHFCAVCFDQHIDFFDKMIEGGKKSMATYKRRLTRMRNKQESAICRQCFKKVLLPYEIETQKCTECRGEKR